MSFDGIPRPSQINPYNDPLGPYSACNAAKAEQAGKPLVKGLSKEEQLKGLPEEHQQQTPQDDRDKGQSFNEAEVEEIMLLAKMRGVLNFAMNPDVHYEFHLNVQSGLVELREVASGKLMLKLTPDELMGLSEKLHRSAGMLTNRSG
jgi:hypothetical protein